MIEVSHLTKQYGNHLAVDDVSFTVADGQICGLLGPNGAGKSTIMNILTGYLSATSGQVTVAGHPLPEEADAAKACVGYLPEQPPLYPEMTVQEYLTLDNADPEQWMREHWELVREQLEKDGSELEITPVRTITEQEDSPAVTVLPIEGKKPKDQ